MVDIAETIWAEFGFLKPSVIFLGRQAHGPPQERSKTRIIFPSGRAGTAADSGFQRGPASTFRTLPGIDCAPRADATRACAAGSRGWLPLRAIPDFPSAGTTGLNRGPGDGRTAAKAPVPGEPLAMRQNKRGGTWGGGELHGLCKLPEAQTARDWLGSGLTRKPGLTRREPKEGFWREAASFRSWTKAALFAVLMSIKVQPTLAWYWKEGPMRERCAGCDAASRKKEIRNQACLLRSDASIFAVAERRCNHRVIGRTLPSIISRLRLEQTRQREPVVLLRNILRCSLEQNSPSPVNLFRRASGRSQYKQCIWLTVFPIHPS